MIHADHENIKQLLLQGNFGLEKESLRVYEDGTLSHTPHPFPDDKHIVYDFCENQTEINTAVAKSAEEAINLLQDHTSHIQKTLSKLERPEVLWPFSNPPYIRSENDIPIAKDYENFGFNTGYRDYLSERYGRYKMSLCGIHVNYSFSDELMQEDFKLSGQNDYQEYINQLYVTLAEKLTAYGWIITAVTAASPLMDSSFVEKGMQGRTSFHGMASTRCSELGYWNYFTPIFDYTDIRAYAASIQKYVDEDLIIAPSELYYPVRLKPSGKNNLQRLHDEGVEHIEIRTVDLNPLEPSGINLKDLKFIQLMIVWLASTPRQSLGKKDQIQAAQNFKNAAHYDLKTVKIGLPNGEVCSVADAGLNVIGFMKEFYKDFPEEIQEILNFEEEKFINPETRYAWIIRKEYTDGFVLKGLELAKKRQDEALV